MLALCSIPIGNADFFVFSYLSHAHPILQLQFLQHTAEDVSIAIGKVLNTALGTKAG